MSFPVVDAILQCPPEGASGKIGICTNTLAPGMVLNEVPFDLRKDLAVLGSLVVNRDGTERMIINALAHPTLEYIILFGEETLSFRPSTNLLLALMHGYDQSRSGNFIPGGKGIGYQYPSISIKLLDHFRERFKVIPFFLGGSDEVMQEYLQWIKPRLPESIFSHVQKIHEKKKFYYDSLQELVKLIAAVPKSSHALIELDPKDFAHLQPPITIITGENKLFSAPFLVTKKNSQIHVQLESEKELFSVAGEDSFLLAYTIATHLHQTNSSISHLEQLLLGSEISRIEMEIKNNIIQPSVVNSTLKKSNPVEIPLAARTVLKADKRFYYKIGLKSNYICVQSLAHDTCETVFEWRGANLTPLLEKIAQENRFESYEQEMLHRMDVGIEMGRAAIALQTNHQFLQDFHLLFTPNLTQFPLLIVEGDSFLGNHQKIITKLYTQGVNMVHADAHKGTMRSAAVLSVFRRSGESLANFPSLYASGDQPIQEVRSLYCAELSSPENKGAYTYGNRTRSFFGRDQLVDAIAFLKKNPNQPCVIQRFDYLTDMTLTQTPITDAAGNVVRTRTEATHDPCLTHDIYFIQNGKLHSFHIARAHNIVNAYAENIFGLHDAYDTLIATGLGLELGDLFMLSNRANILLLTEEQKAKRLMAEPTKPVGDLDSAAGPFAIRDEFPSNGLGYAIIPLEFHQEKPNHPCLASLENYDNVNLIQKSVHYLKTKGTTHNNPILGTFHPQNPILDEAHRLVFFQCNEQGGSLHASAVFLDGNPHFFKKDLELCHYIATQHANELQLPLGDLFYFALPCANEPK